jgi:hypothetical protein
MVVGDRSLYLDCQCSRENVQDARYMDCRLGLAATRCPGLQATGSDSGIDYLRIEYCSWCFDPAAAFDYRVLKVVRP